LAPIKNATANVLKGTIIEFVDQGPTVAITVDAGLTFKVIMIKSFFIEKKILKLDKKHGLPSKVKPLKYCSDL
jgi:hypothetical protein